MAEAKTPVMIEAAAHNRVHDATCGVRFRRLHLAIVPTELEWSLEQLALKRECSRSGRRLIAQHRSGTKLQKELEHQTNRRSGICILKNGVASRLVLRTLLQPARRGSAAMPDTDSVPLYIELGQVHHRGD